LAKQLEQVKKQSPHSESIIKHILILYWSKWELLLFYVYNQSLPKKDFREA